MKCTILRSIKIIDFARYLGASVVLLKKELLPEESKSVCVAITLDMPVLSNGLSNLPFQSTIS